MRPTESPVADRTAVLECLPDGTPTALAWDRRHWRVTDAPTRLEDTLGMLLTHPLPVRGWRFQGTASDNADSFIFDVLRFDELWCVVRTYR